MARICDQCGRHMREMTQSPDFCEGCVTDVLADSTEITVDQTHALCPQCGHANVINWWWHSESRDQWVCYGCGMDRNREYQKDQEGLKKILKKIK